MRRWAAVLLLCSAAGAALAETRIVELRVEQRSLLEGPEPLRVVRGTELERRWPVDRPLALHLHGYDIEVAAAPGTVAAMRLTARATGRFPIEIHDSAPGHARPLLYLEVVPR